MKGLKIATLGLMLVLVLAGLAACGGGQDIEATSDSSFRIITATPRNTATPTVTPTPLVPQLESGALQDVQVEFWYVWDPTTPDTLDEIVRQFNRGNEEGINVVTRRFSNPADFETSMQEAIAIRRTPDVVLAHAYQYTTWQKVAVLVELSPYLESPAYGLTAAELDQFYPALLSRDLYGTDRYGFPGLFSVRVMLYNQTWARELGFGTPPTSAAGFSQQACAAHQENGDLTGGWMINTSPGSAAAWLLAFSGGLESRGQYAFDSAEVQAAFSFLSDLRVSGCAWQPSSAYPDQAFVDRLGLFYPVSSREIGHVQQAFDQSGSTDQWTAVAYPNDLGESHVSLYGESYVLLDSSLEEQVAAWLFVRAMTSESNQLRLAEATLYLPLSRQVSADLQADGDLPHAWLDALDLLDQAVYEPRFSSWRVVRGVVQDALAEVMDERFVPGTMSLFLKQLQELAAELHQTN